MGSNSRDMWTEKYGKESPVALPGSIRPAPLKKPKGMNKTEAAYSESLELRKRAGEILDYRYEPCGLKLADKTYYHPDFMVIYPEFIEFVEIKGGHIWDDSIVKFKVTAEQFPWFRFVMIQKKKGEPYKIIREI